MILLYLTVTAFACSRVFTSIWLQIWLDAGDGQELERRNNLTFLLEFNKNVTNLSTIPEVELKGFVTDNPNLSWYQWVYVSTLLVMIALGLIKSFSLAFRFLFGSSVMHDQMLHRIMRSPIAFFDTTPAGTILNRFSKDMDESEHCLVHSGSSITTLNTLHLVTTSYVPIP